MRFFGGPAGLAPAGTKGGDQVFSDGNSSLRLALAARSPKRGVSLGTDAGGWHHTVVTATPGVPGDSGLDGHAATRVTLANGTEPFSSTLDGRLMRQLAAGLDSMLRRV